MKVEIQRGTEPSDVMQTHAAKDMVQGTHTDTQPSDVMQRHATKDAVQRRGGHLKPKNANHLSQAQKKYVLRSLCQGIDRKK
jgi:hypothetical protein